MSNWVCYLLKSVDGNKTYVGATDNLYRRLCDHNGLNGASKGAKATKGHMWYPILCVSGFSTKVGCLSFESGVRRIRKRKCPHLYSRPKQASAPELRIIDIFNLLQVGSPLGKWHSSGLCINWLEREFRQPYLASPPGVKEITDFHELVINQ